MACIFWPQGIRLRKSYFLSIVVTSSLARVVYIAETISLIYTFDQVYPADTWGGTPGDAADVSAIKRLSTFRNSRYRGFRYECKKINPSRNTTTPGIRIESLCSGNKGVVIWKVDVSFVAQTSAASPGIPWHRQRGVCRRGLFFEKRILNWTNLST